MKLQISSPADAMYLMACEGNRLKVKHDGGTHFFIAAGEMFQMTKMFEEVVQ